MCFFYSIAVSKYHNIPIHTELREARSSLTPSANNKCA